MFPELRDNSDVGVTGLEIILGIGNIAVQHTRHESTSSTTTGPLPCQQDIKPREKVGMMLQGNKCDGVAISYVDRCGR